MPSSRYGREATRNAPRRALAQGTISFACDRRFVNVGRISRPTFIRCDELEHSRVGGPILSFVTKRTPLTAATALMKGPLCEAFRLGRKAFLI
jgi:hypothetical protein